MVIFCNRRRKETPFDCRRRRKESPDPEVFSKKHGIGVSLRRLPQSSTRTGALMVEFLVALALVLGALLPLAYSFAKEEHLARAYYQRAIAMELVDGEIELLAAGGWKDYATGVSEYRVRAAAAANLPPGKFLITRTQKMIKLEWLPDLKQHGGKVAREVRLP